MPEHQPLVSVCMPVFCGAPHLAAAIDSVLEQTLTDFELIIVDDCSSDASPDIVSKYRDPRIRYLRNQINLGAQDNWNRALSLARGKYFKLMPQDDLLAATCLADQVAVLENDSAQHVALVFGGRAIIDASGRQLMRRSRFGSVQKKINAHELIYACIRGGTNLIGEPGNVLMRLDLARRIGEFDGAYGYMIDLDYWFRALRHGRAIYLPQNMSFFRISAGSWSVAIGARQKSEFNAFIRKCMRDPQFIHVGKVDLWRSMIMASLNARLRSAIYRWSLRS